MPTVPGLNTQVSQNGFPGVRVPTDVPAEALGGGSVAKSLEGSTKQMSSDMIEVVERSYHQANNAANVTNRNWTDDYAQNQVYGGVDATGKQNPGVLDKIKNSGQDAPKVADDFFQKYDKDISNKAAELPNDDQRAAFLGNAAVQRRNLNKTIQTHLGAEQQRYQAQTTEASLKNSVDLGAQNYMDHDTVDQYADRIISSARDYGFLHGQSDDEIAQVQGKHLSQLYANVTQRYFANGQDQAGKEYYDTVKDNITDHDVKLSMDKMVKEGVLKGDAQKQAASIVGQYTDKNAAYEAVQEIKDPELQDKVRSMVDTGMSLKLQKAQSQSDNEFLTAMDSVQKSGSMNAIPPQIAGNLTPNQNRALQKISDNANGAKPIQNNSDVFNEYMAKTPMELSKVDPMEIATKVRSNLDDYHFAKFKDQWQLSREGVGGNQASLSKVTAQQMNDQTIVESMAYAGIGNLKPGSTMRTVNTNPETRTTFDSVNTEVQNKIIDAQQKKGKPLSQGEVRDISNQVVREKVFLPDPKWYNSEAGQDKIYAELNPEQKKSFTVRIGDVPDNVKNEIYKAGVMSGGIPTTMDPQTAQSKYKGNFEKAAATLIRGGSMNDVRDIMGNK